MAGVADQSYYKNRKPHSISKAVVKSAVDEIIRAISPLINKPLSEWVILDIGAGTGDYTLEFARRAKEVIAVEPYKEAYNQGFKKTKSYKNIKFFNVLVEDLVIKRKFDLALSLTTIEHMSQPRESFNRVFALLKEDGVIYITAPNKLWPYDNHYKLPFLTWLPIPLANIYVRMMNRGTDYIDSSYSKTYFGMKNIFSNLPCTYKFYLPTNLSSEYFGCGEGGISYKLLRKTGVFLIQRSSFFWLFSKGFIMIVQKRKKY